MSTEFVDEDALKYVLAQPQGRKVIWGLLGAFGLYRNPRVPSDPEGTSFNCGLMNAGQMLYADCLSASPDFTAMMIKEQGNDDNRPEPAVEQHSERPVSRVEHATDLGADDGTGADDPLGLGFYRSGR